MQFLNPIWLFAIAAISIPVVIHLWNIKPGKTLKVGSIALITAAAQKSSRSFKLNDILLFVVRCLFLLTLALLLAVPFWQRYQAPVRAEGWVLIPKENLKESYKKLKFVIDSLAKSGYEFHFFDEKFQKFELNKALDDSLLKDKPKVKNYWTLVEKLDEKLPAGIPVYLITPNQKKYFSGTRPSVSLNLHWQTYTPADSMSTWIESAWFTNNNSIKVTEGNSKSSGTYFTNYIIQSEGDPKSPFIVDVNGGKPLISLKNTPGKVISIDTNTFKIAIYTDKYATDAAYLKAALTAAGNFTGHKIVIKQYGNESQILTGQDWLFWLSDKPIDANNLKKTSHLLNYAPGEEINTSSSIKTNGVFSLSDLEVEASLYKLIKKEPLTNSQPVWIDGYGNPVLSKELNQQTTQYYFYSRFNPAWNDLVWSNSFPKLLLKLILYNTDNELIKEHDLTEISHQQLMPDTISPAKNTADDKPVEQIDLSHYFWITLAMAFFIERWLAHKNKLVIKHG
ncbi:BatA domain-containing protein [Mucilaginibacter sp. FT3.2]|uniref:BatA domain-containing protein n=1 Tax=Mucilaginibacter sp. FT3.2 TaxID=2723090 RepID=UPI00161B989E|nr:BatA domain-containing protein [Mucilaginibacter sp. FT3.2]MBB6232543.1 hypothetical protein [Mucilaginibacter sp. FT3.2]